MPAPGRSPPCTSTCGPASGSTGSSGWPRRGPTGSTTYQQRYGRAYVRVAVQRSLRPGSHALVIAGRPGTPISAVGVTCRRQEAGQPVACAMEHVQWSSRPSLGAPVVLAAFTGWNDAGDAASRRVRHLIDVWRAEPFAALDPEEFYDFESTRPQVRLVDGLTREIVWPANELLAASTPGRRRRCCISAPSRSCGGGRSAVSSPRSPPSRRSPLVLTLGALLADVPHSGRCRSSAPATDAGARSTATSWPGRATRARPASWACCTTLRPRRARRRRRCGRPCRRTRPARRRPRRPWRWSATRPA